MRGMCIGAAKPIGATPKTDIFKSEKPYAEPIGAAQNEPCLFRLTSSFVCCLYRLPLTIRIDFGFCARVRIAALEIP